MNIPAFFLKNKIKSFLSIDFGQAFAKIAYIQSLGDNFTLIDYDFKKISLTEENKSEFTEFINNFLKKNLITAKETYLTISDSDAIFIKHFVLPVLPREETQDALKWQLKGEPGFDLKSFVIDWQIVKEYTDQDGAKNNEVACIFATLDFINKYLAVVTECRLTAVSISISPFNYANVLKSFPDPSSITALLDIGYKYTTLCIYRNNRLNFIRKLDFSSDKLTHSLTKPAEQDNLKTKFSYEEAEDIKKSIEIPRDEDEISEQDIREIQIISLIRPLLEGLVKELKRSFDYFSSTSKEESPLSLYITGGGASLKNLEWYLNKELNIKVDLLPFPVRINKNPSGKTLTKSQENQLISTLGAVLADRGTVNLLPQEIRTQKIEQVEKISLRLIALTVSAILLSSLFMINFQIRDYQKRLKSAQFYLKGISEVKILKQKINLREIIIDNLQKGHVPVDGLLKLVSAIIPNNLILDELAINQMDHSLILKGQISVSEGAFETAIANFMKQLETSQFIEDATLITSNKVGQVQSFEIKCKLAN